MNAPTATGKLRLGVSGCLLGEAVRFDGGHKHDRYLTDVLGRWFDFVPVCPEVGIGMGVPREPIRLVQIGEGVRVRGVPAPEVDFTDALAGYVDVVADDLAGIVGYVLKRASPTCGMERVKVYPVGGGASRPVGTGAFAAALMRRWPRLPVEEEGRLDDPILRENFIERLFVYARLRPLLAAPTAVSLMAFHDRHELLVMAHGQAAGERLGRLVATAGTTDPRAVAEDYADALMQALRRRATRRRHAHVLEHLAGHLKRALDADDEAELRETITAYRLARVPLVVPMTLLRHHLRRNPHPHLQDQHYLAPHPAELMLRG